MKSILFISLFLLDVSECEKKERLSNRKSKSVRFSDKLVREQSSDYFDFGQQSTKGKIKRKEKEFTNTIKSTKSKPPHNPPPLPYKKLKSALKSTNTNHVSSNGGGAFNISSFGTSNSNRAFYNDPSSIGQQLDDYSNIYGANSISDNGASPQISQRNVGPTPELISSLSPERFWLPPNAPITKEIPGPFLPYYQGVPGKVIFDSNIPIPEDAYSPQVTDLTGPRDPISNFAKELTRQNGVASIGNYEPPFKPPCEILPLNQVTPLPGGNIIDPLSPQVNNVRGPFFPNNPVTDGAFLVTNSQMEMDLEDGTYSAERVIDPIVFFDPLQGQAVVFDPLRNFTRLYNTETEPELPAEAFESGTASTPSTQSIFNQNSLLKSSGVPPSQPLFWILKRQEIELETDGNNCNGLEKSGINGNCESGNKNGASAPRILFQSKSLAASPKVDKKTTKTKKPIIRVSHYKAPNIPPQQQRNAQIDPKEHFRIQLASSNPNEPSKEATKPSDNGDNKKVQITLVYRPIVDIELGKRYKGFKAANNNNNSASKLAPLLSIKTTISVFIALFLVIFLI